MSEVTIGRVLVASLHQAISDTLPLRLGFYENWLDAKGLRDGTIGLAPLYAVLSFLRQEGSAYEAVMARAGAYGAEWTVSSMRPGTYAAMCAMPTWLRVRLAMRLVRRLVRETYRDSRASYRVRGGVAQLTIRKSVFCTVREPVGHPLCGYYAAASARVLELLRVGTIAGMAACRATGQSACLIELTVAGALAPAEPLVTP
jgi:predicted hydrocarbon binding protein